MSVSPVPGLVVPAGPPAPGSSWARALQRVIVADAVMALDIARVSPPAGVVVQARVAVSASQPEPECASYHALVARLEGGQLVVRCSCPAGSPRSGQAPQVCKHAVVALIALGFGPSLGVPAGFAEAVFSPSCVVR